MNFKEALIAHLQGERVEKRSALTNNMEWVPLREGCDSATLEQLLDKNFGGACEFRLAPRTILVNGVEVPAPESEAPKKHTYFFLPDFEMDSMFVEDYWVASQDDNRLLERGLVYLNKEDAIARAKAMLLHE